MTHTLPQVPQDGQGNERYTSFEEMAANILERAAYAQIANAEACMERVTDGRTENERQSAWKWLARRAR